MAMYKEEDISVSLIETKFPAIASALAAKGQKPVTLEAIKEENPEIISALHKEWNDGGDDIAANAAMAERERILSIQALSVPGQEEVIKAAINDGVSDTTTVKVKLFDALQDSRKKIITSHKEDGEKLGKLAEELANTDDEESQKEAEKTAKKNQNTNAMLSGVKNRKGE